MEVFIETRGPSAPGFNETSTGFKFLPQKHVKPPKNPRRFTETWQKKKKRGFLLKPMINLIFFIYIVFHMKLADRKKVVMAKSHLKARFHMQTGFIFLFYCHTVSAETVE